MYHADSYCRELQLTVQPLLSQEGSTGSLAEAARAIQVLAENWLSRTIEQEELIACQAGCGDCCIVNVAVLEPEVDAILEYLRAERTVLELQELADRARQMHLQVSGLDDEERILARQPCLFLDGQGCCSIYPVRPLLCRALTSTDPDRCREALAMLALGEEVSILANQRQQEIFNTAFEELGGALEDSGRDGRSQPLTTAIHHSLRFKT